MLAYSPSVDAGCFRTGGSDNKVCIVKASAQNPTRKKDFTTRLIQLFHSSSSRPPFYASTYSHHCSTSHNKYIQCILCRLYTHSPNLCKCCKMFPPTITFVLSLLLLLFLLPVPLNPSPLQHFTVIRPQQPTHVFSFLFLFSCTAFAIAMSFSLAERQTASQPAFDNWKP